MPIWKANDAGFYKALIKSLSYLANLAASLIDALHESKA